MDVLLIQNNQDLIFKSKPTKSVSREIETQNNFASNIAKSEIASNPKLLKFIKLYFDFSSNNYLTSTSDQINLEKLVFGKFSSILNLKKVNDIRYINKFFETVNVILPKSGLYLGKVVTYPNRRSAILNKYPPILNKLIYFIDYIFSRVIPKLPILKKIYFYLTNGRGRVISRAETFGRLYSCGFEIIDEISINHSLFFVAKKVKDPYYDNNPTYAPIISLNRIGKNGKIFKVYKLRTMHPFSEYLQEYVYNKNQLKEGGKIKNDFRISPEGRIFRKFWIDELPMFINFFKGEMKLVGVRPLSEHFFSLYTKELQTLRINTKPGLIPPFYVDMPTTLEEIMASEIKYLKAYKKRPYQTDFIYFFKSLYNILIKNKRSS
jgi:lipopolysaccharide/colanic/teichoic acid biosynthesis glycosyltransferase